MPPPAEAPRAASTRTARGTHVLEVTGYSLTKGIGVARYVASSAFAVGGHDWAVRFYPDGDEPGSLGYVSVSLDLLTKNARVRASFNLGLVDQTTGLPSFESEPVTAVFDTTGGDHEPSSRGKPRFKKRRDLEASPAYHRQRDTVAVECVVTVIDDTLPVPEDRRWVPEAEAPASDLPRHLGWLLVEQKGADVTFDVEGEAFAAHKIVLAARSPVFEAELYGPTATRGNDSQRVTVHDMRPDVFRALLNFIYTDSLPAMRDLDAHAIREVIQHLLAAADRYAMERLKAMCERVLARMLDAETAAATLYLADRHRCSGLKDACIEFIISSDRMDDAARSRCFAQLGRTLPSVLAEELEKAVVLSFAKEAHDFTHQAFTWLVVFITRKEFEGTPEQQGDLPQDQQDPLLLDPGLANQDQYEYYQDQEGEGNEGGGS